MSEPKPFSWPGLAKDADPIGGSAAAAPIDPAQAAADAAAAGHQQGFDRGYAEGLAQGEQEAKQQAEQEFAQIHAVLAQAERFASHWQGAQVELVRRIAVRFLGEELLENPQRLETLLHQGRALLPSSLELTLACHPDVQAALEGKLPCPLISDPGLPPGSFELRQGQATLELNLDAVVATAFAGLDLNCHPVTAED